ncbi:MAG: hypothetical protein ACKOET_16830, partial [Verrucomicrobiota bacterium]
LAAARSLEAAAPALQQAVASASGDARALATRALATNRAQHFNHLLDAAVTGIFLSLALLVVATAVREWLRLLAGSRPPDLQETTPVWLPASALAPPPGRHRGRLGAAGLTLALLRHWSGQDAVDRAAQAACPHATGSGKRILIDLPEVRTALARKAAGQAYAAAAEQRLAGPNRCC